MKSKSRGTLSVISRTKCRTWIFQANPDKYQIEESLKVEQSEYWNLNQHAKEVHKGDRVLIWISGPDAGIYALGTVMEEPILRADSERGLGYWHNIADGQKVKPRVLVHYDKVFLDRPLHKVFLEFDPTLDSLQILRFALGTNFPVTDEQWYAIKNWLEQPAE